MRNRPKPRKRKSYKPLLVEVSPYKIIKPNYNYGYEKAWI